MARFYDITFDVLSDSQESSVRNWESKKLELKLELEASTSSLLSSFIWWRNVNIWIEIDI